MTMHRFITKDELVTLAEVLLGTDDDLEIGISQVGLDPDELSTSDLGLIRRKLARKGIIQDDEGTWSRSE